VRSAKSLSIAEQADPQHVREEVERELPLVREMLLAFMVMFQGYGTLVGNPQHSLKSVIGISGFGSHEAERFTTATNLFQWGKCATRVLQIIFLVAMEPRGLVNLAYVLMFVAMLIPPVFIFAADLVHLWFPLVACTYFLGGVAVGIFEGTFLSVTSALGRNTKLFAIMGAPLGFAMLNIVLGTALGFGMPVEVYYYYSAACIPAGMMIFQKKAPRAAGLAAAKGCIPFCRSLRAAGSWLPSMIPLLLAKCVGNFVLENTFPLTYNVYNEDKVPLFGGPSSTTGLVPKQYYLSLYFFVLMAIGDTVSRRVPLYINTSSFWKTQALLVGATFLCFGGEALLFLITPLVTGVGTYVALFGQGFIYGLSAKYIDTFVPQEHNYAAYMLWCFAGDIGGIVGSSFVVNRMAAAVCEGRSYEYVCHAAKKAASLRMEAARKLMVTS